MKRLKKFLLSKAKLPECLLILFLVVLGCTPSIYLNVFELPVEQAYEGCYCYTVFDDNACPCHLRKTLCPSVPCSTRWLNPFYTSGFPGVAERSCSEDSFDNLHSQGFFKIFPENAMSNGQINTDFTTDADQITAAARQPDGKIVVAGASRYNGPAPPRSTDFALARYHPDGSLDASFGAGGKDTTDFFGGAGDERATALAIQPDGKIVVAGAANSDTQNFNNADFALARYNADGSLDASFGTGGKLTTNIFDGQTRLDAAASVVLQPDGKIVVAGITSPAATDGLDFALVRYTPNGGLDESFGAGGKVTTNFPDNLTILSAVILQPDGKLVAAGTAIEPKIGTMDFALARYNPDGSLDTGFDGDGKVVSDFFGSADDPREDIVGGAALQPDGKIVIAGTSEKTPERTTADFAVARYNPNGSLDTTFGTDGITTTDFSGAFDMASSVILQPDGKIVAGGVTNGLIGQDVNVPLLSVSGIAPSPFASDFGIARYLPNGALDSSFGTGGKSVTDFFGSVDAVTDLAFDADGNILAAGFTQTTPLSDPDGKNGTGVQTDSDLQNVDFAIERFRSTAWQRRKAHDFDGDGRAEIAVFRPSTGSWYILTSFFGGFLAEQFGISTDRAAPGDYDGDGITDIGVYRDGAWYVLRSSDRSFLAVHFGVAEDRPVPDDYDGDGVTDFAVFRPSNGTWYLLRSAAGFIGIRFGISEDVPVAGDYDGDGRADIAVFRPSSGNWYLRQSRNGFLAIQFGTNGDRPLIADFDGDFRNDVAVFRPSNGTWYYLQSSNNQFFAVQFGTGGDVPVPADYDGDQSSDIAVFRPANGTWYRLNKSDGQLRAAQFGVSGDIPIPAAP